MDCLTRNPAARCTQAGSLSAVLAIVIGWKQLEGKIKAKWGKLTAHDLTAINGRREELEGKIQQRYGIAKDQARSTTGSRRKAFDIDPTGSGSGNNPPRVFRGRSLLSAS